MPLTFNLSPKERVRKARLKLMNTHPFFGYVLYQIPVVAKDEPKPKGVRIVYNPEYVEKLDDEELKFVLVHEAMHYLLGHAERTRAFKRKMSKSMSEEERKKFATLMNIAEDIVINTILFMNGFKVPERTHETPFGTVKEGAIKPRHLGVNSYLVELVDAKGRKFAVSNPQDKSAEEIYFEIKDFELVEGSNEQMTAQLEVDDEGGGEGKWVEGEAGYKPGENAIRPEELMTKAVNYSKMAGSMPAGIDVMVGELTKPKLDLIPFLKRFLVQMVPHNYTYLRPAKNSPEDIILPDVERKPHVTAMVALDTSGSMDAEKLAKCMAEIVNFARSNNVNLTFVTCDAEVQDIYKKVTNPKKLLKLKLRGGGGTDFRPVFELAEKMRARFLIFFTDGYGAFPEKTRIQTLWVLTPDGVPESRIPFGKVVRII